MDAASASTDAASASTGAASASTASASFWVIMDVNGFFWNIDSNVGTRGTIVLDVEVICKVVVPRAMQVAVRCEVGECNATEPKD